jgi:tRNA C32,U32 (ribose-2'-O)-methylase TrmJ
MEKDNYKTDVMFRVDKSGDNKGVVYALLPHEAYNHSGSVTSYEHVGQHGKADYNYCISKTRPATEKEYSALKEEMESIGYDINVVKKRNYNKYLESLQSILTRQA